MAHITSYWEGGLKRLQIILHLLSVSNAKPVQSNETAVLIVQMKLDDAKCHYMTAHILSSQLEMCTLEHTPSVQSDDLKNKELATFAYTSNRGIVITCGGYDKGLKLVMKRCLYWSLVDKGQVK